MIEIRALHNHDEFVEAVRLQQLIWGFEEVELLPVRLFVTATKVGGQAFGAFDGGNMVGFCLAIPGIKAKDKPYLHSHMLGVLKDYRDAGVGRMLKLEQRREALSRGIELMEWTFDPLEIKNAYFNMERLGAIVRRFVLNQYGTTSSKLHAGLPTDRCIAEWWLASPRVKSILAGEKLPQSEIVARISVPSDIYTIKETDPTRAREIQKRVSDQFLQHFSKGLAVTGFERTQESGTYLFTHWSNPWDSK
ncbi:MAG TPA: GNAT family N-acetyltransferase [Bryobacteraceae bacterium]|nr:GNAT family N-acetyltransferase [Bryobacteraceae bacterium]